MGAVWCLPFAFALAPVLRLFERARFPCISLLEDLPFLDFALFHFFLFSRFSFGIRSWCFGISNSPALIPLLLFVLVFIYSHRSGSIIVRRVLEKYTTNLKGKGKSGQSGKNNQISKPHLVSIGLAVHGIGPLSSLLPVSATTSW